VVHEAQPDELAAAPQPLGEVDVLRRRCRVAAGVVVGQDHRVRPELDRGAQDLARLQHRVRFGPRGESADREGAQSPVEEEGVDLLVREPGEARL